MPRIHDVMRFPEARVFVQKHEVSGILLTLSKGLLVAAFVIGGWGRYVFLEWMPLIVLLCAATGIGFLVASLRLGLRTPMTSPGMEVDLGGLSIAARRIARDEILSALIVRRSDPPDEHTHVELTLSPRFRRVPWQPVTPGDSIAIELSEEDARETLRQLTGDKWQTQRRVRLGGDTVLLTAVRTCLIFGLALLACVVLGGRLGETERQAYVWGITIFPLVFIGLHELVVVLRRTPTLSILRDGLLVHSTTHKNFIAWADFVNIETENSELRIECKHRTVRISAYRMDRARLQSIVAFVRGLVAQQKHLRSEHFGVYGHRGSPASDWLQRIRELVTTPSYRANSTSIDEAITVLTSPVTTADERVGAAIALRLTGIDLSATQFRVADIASDEVRTTIYRVIDAAKDEELETELRRITDLHGKV